MKHVKLDNGKYRYSVKCKLCKSKWISETHAGYHSDIEHSISMTHRCDKLRDRITIWGYSDWSVYFAKMKNLIPTHLVIKPVLHTVRADGGHQCDDRCMGAKGNNCECECGGKNHGSLAVA